MMKRVWIDSVGINFQSAFRNLKSAILVGATLLALSVPADAQPQAKTPRIGWLGARSVSGPGGRQGSGADLFGREFGKLGYVEGKNLTIDYRYADNKLDRLPALADELVRLKVDVIIAPTTVESRAAKNATRTIPIVFFNVPDPVASGLVDSLARPGGTSRGSPRFRRCWLANDWSYSRKPFQIFPALQCCGIHRIQPLRNNGKKANCRHEKWACNFIPWRSAASTNSRVRSKRQ